MCYFEVQQEKDDDGKSGLISNPEKDPLPHSAHHRALILKLFTLIETNKITSSKKPTLFEKALIKTFKLGLLCDRNRKQALA